MLWSTTDLSCTLAAEERNLELQERILVVILSTKESQSVAEMRLKVRGTPKYLKGSLPRGSYVSWAI